MNYPDGPYGTDPSFKHKLEVSWERISEFYAPSITQSGLTILATQADHECIRLSKDVEERYFFEDRDIRLADIMAISHGIVMENGSPMPVVYFEVKDFPRFNNFPLSGFRPRLVARYLAIQHALQVPIVLLFMDDPKRELGTEKLAPMKSLYKDERGQCVPYGGLLCDLVPNLSMSYTDKTWNREKKHQIVWVTENEYEERRMMMPLDQICATLLGHTLWGRPIPPKGRLRGKLVRPLDLPLWSLIDCENARREGVRLRFRPEELTIFSFNP